MNESERELTEQLREEVATLREALHYLAYAKQTDTEYAFFDWLVKNEVFGDTRTRLTVVLGVLGERLDGTPLTRKHDIPGVSSELLYRDQPPTYDEALQVLTQALDMPEHIIDELLDAFEAQGIQPALVALRRGARAMP